MKHGSYKGNAKAACNQHGNLQNGGRILKQFKYINQLDATTFQVYYLTFMYSSTGFERLHAHDQELNCSSSLWFYRCSVAIAVLLVVVGPAGRPNHDQHHCYHHAATVKPEAATAVELLIMGVRTPETC
jgi:hypothetical protein